VVWLLDKIYAETEQDAGLEAAKRAAMSEVYASQYLDCRDQVFRPWHECRVAALFRRGLALVPGKFKSGPHLRLWLATFLPRPLYESVKKRLKPHP